MAREQQPATPREIATLQALMSSPEVQHAWVNAAVAQRRKTGANFVIGLVGAADTLGLGPSTIEDFSQGRVMQGLLKVGLVTVMEVFPVANRIIEGRRHREAKDELKQAVDQFIQSSKQTETNSTEPEKGQA